MTYRFKEVSSNGKPYRIRRHDCDTDDGAEVSDGDRSFETLLLISDAKKLFFAIAEDGISVPSYLRNPENGRIITDRHEIAQIAIGYRERLYARTNKERFAGAKLAGAYVNMIEVLADDILLLYQAGDKKTAEEKRHEMSGYYKKVQNLISCINLKGQKADIDRVLFALLGEVPKAALQGNALAHDSEYVNTSRAMYEVDHLIEWMKEVTARQVEFSGCRESIHQLGEAVKERLNWRRQELESRDESDVQVRMLSSNLRKMVDSVAKQHKKLHPVAEDLLRACDVINDMIKQGEKPVSVSLIMGIRQVDVMTDTLKALFAPLPPEIKKNALKALNVLQNSEKTYMLNMLRHGRSREYIQDDFLDSLSSAVGTPFTIPSSLEKTVQPVIDAFRSGMEIMGRIPPDLSLGNDAIVKARESSDAEIAAYIDKCNGLAHPRGH